ncbi:hypothetical protein ACLOJK_001778 [Asimina triloba]
MGGTISHDATNESDWEELQGNDLQQLRNEEGSDLSSYASSYELDDNLHVDIPNTFNDVVERLNPKMVLGKQFQGKKQFEQALRQYDVLIGFDLMHFDW